jgi:hypothetical protein
MTLLANTKKEDIDQSAWNLSQHIINLIGELLKTASQKFRKGDIQGCYWDGEEVRILIEDDLDETEKQQLQDYELNISRLYAMTKIKSNMNKEEYPEEIRKQISLAKNTHYKKVKDYRKYLMRLLGKYGYLVSKKENAAKIF